MVTIYDIARKANVSAMTVSRVINNKGRVSEKTRAKVRAIMAELNYVPNEMARSLVLRESQVLFLLITDITNPFFTTLARGAEDAANKLGYRVLFGNSDESLGKEEQYVETILKSRVDGVLMAPAGDRSLASLQMLKSHGVPYVLLDREVPGVDSDVVMGDSVEGTRMLMEHLLEMGHREIALVSGSRDVSNARLRAAGYRDALKRYGLAFLEGRMLELDYAARGKLQLVAGWLQAMNPLPTAILCGNNMLAIQVIQAIRQCGLQVPRDVSVACFDDLGAAGEIDPFLTVVAQQAYQFGFIGMELLIQRIAVKQTAGQQVELEQEAREPWQEPWKKIILPSELIPRRSVANLNQP